MGNILERIEEIRKIDLTKTLKLTSPLPPTVNHYLGHRAFNMNVNGKLVPTVNVYVTSEAKKYQAKFAEYVKNIVANEKWDIRNTYIKHFYLDCIFYLDRIDIDNQNLYKCPCDAVNSIAYKDDQSILVRSQRLYYDTVNPRMEIELKPVEYIGIFDDLDELDRFMMQCNKCSRLNNNCSVLNKAIDGRLQDEIVMSAHIGKICNKFKEMKAEKASKVSKLKVSSN